MTCEVLVWKDLGWWVGGSRAGKGERVKGEGVGHSVKGTGGY